MTAIARDLGLATALFVLAGAAAAQVEHGGRPYSHRRALQGQVPTVRMPAVDSARLRAESAERRPGEPHRWGELVETELGLDDAGVWTRLPGGDRLWRLRVRSPGAYSLMLTFSRFQLPEGAELFVYGDDRQVVRGAYTYRNHHPDGRFVVQPTPGDALTLEYYEPAAVHAPGEIVLSGVVHDYDDILDKGGGLGSSGSCEVDVACPEGMGWADQIDAVVRILAPNGCCTGILLNNTAQDGTRYVLSAEHCGDLTNAVFQFNWKRPNCGSGMPLAQSDTVTGASIAVSAPALDFQLVRLETPIPQSYGAKLAGWDRTDAVPTDTVTLHHPKGDAMKISIDDDPPVKTGTRWNIVDWETGVTEGGSSGSALFSPEGRVIGLLCCGSANCMFPGNDFYGRLAQRWPLLAPHLDPLDSGMLELDGFDLAAYTPPAFGVSAVSPGQVPALMPGTERAVHVLGTSFTPQTTVDLDGAPLDPALYGYFSNSIIAVDMPQVPIGKHTFTVHEGGMSVDVSFDVVANAGPTLQVGTGDPGNTISSFTGVDVLYAGTVGHMHVCFWSLSDVPSVHPLAMLGLGNQFTQLMKCSPVTIPAAGWVKVPQGFSSMIKAPVYGQTWCLTEGLPARVSNLQEAFAF